MFSSTFSSYKFDRDRELLDIVRQATFVLKLKAQNRLLENGFNDQDVHTKELQLVNFLFQLENVVSFLDEGTRRNDLDLSFAGLAERWS